MTENPTETERNVIISSFFGVLLCFYHVSTMNFSKSLTLFQYLMDKKSLVKSILRQKVTKFLASDEIFNDENFLPTKLSTDEISTDKVFEFGWRH